MAEEKSGESLDWGVFSDSGGSSGGASSAVPSVSKKWIPGPPAHTLTTSQAKRKYEAIQNSDYFLDASIPRRNEMMREYSSYYTQAHKGDPPEAVDGLGYELTKQGITKQGLEEQQEKFRLRDEDADMKKGIYELEFLVGGKKAAEETRKSALKILGRYASPEDREYIEAQNLGNDPNFIKLLSDLHQMLQRGNKKGDRK